MRSQLGRALAALVLATGVANADGGAPVRIRDVRVGDHEGFERVVIELDRDTDIVWENGPEPGEESFYIAAAPPQPSKLIVTQLPEVGTISITEMKGGTHVAIEPKARRVRAYVLDLPPRLVIDLAPPGPGAFEPPAGARALAAAKSLGPLVLEPEPAPEPEPVPEPTPAPVPEPTPAPVPEPVPEAEPAPQVVPEPAPLPKLEPAPEPIPQPAPLPEPRVEPEPPLPAPTPLPKAPTPFGYWIALVAGLGALALLVVLAFRRRALRREAEPVVVAALEPPRTGVDEIAPEEIYGTGERERALEQRLDQEVRARVALEERFAQANEELKVLRDRLHRVERRRELES